MKIIGGILIAFGLVDRIGVDLPEFIWYISGYVETGVGYFIYNLGSKNAEIPTDE